VIIPRVFSDTPKLKADIDRAAHSLRGDVVHIFYELGFDWMGDASIFFKIVLRDRSSKPEKLGQVANRVSLTLMNELKTDEKGVHAYFNFRSQSEVAQMKDPSWTGHAAGR
jgi:hypothetical protein